MPRSLKLYLIVVVALGALALVATTLLFEPARAIAIQIPDALDPPEPIRIAAGILFWIAIALAASPLPVSLPRGTQLGVSTAPILAAMARGGPAIAAWVAAIGTTEMREVRGRIPWYGTLANHAGIVIPAVVAGAVYDFLTHPPYVGFLASDLFYTFGALMAAAVAFFF